MSTIVVQAFSTLDGVVQSGGGPDEDREGNFMHGGWQSDYPVAEIAELVSGWERATDALLLGRKTYEIWASYWGVNDENADGLDGELTRRYNRVPKYVASRTLTALDWKNSVLLDPDVPAAVARLRAQPGGEIRVWGSTELIKTLALHDLIDEYRLVIYPLVLGEGKRLFGNGFGRTPLTLVDTRALPLGVQVNTYRPSHAV